MDAQIARTLQVPRIPLAPGPPRSVRCGPLAAEELCGEGRTLFDHDIQELGIGEEKPGDLPHAVLKDQHHLQEDFELSHEALKGYDKEYEKREGLAEEARASHGETSFFGRRESQNHVGWRAAGL